ncbi:MAG: penicillin-binding protein activator [Alphaproteobacteria bacterium]|nr:penicillin-binding protein activator [Alphaproteobacteria bacterium]
MVLSLCACVSNRIRMGGGQNELYTETNDINVIAHEDFRVGVLLPLSGEFAKQGNGLKNATMMALDDLGDNAPVLQYYDTKGTPEGASIAVENALNQGAELIIGPMLSTSVQAIKPAVKSRGVPVIAFNSASDVLQDGIYTMGLLLEEQVDRIMTYTANKGRTRFAVLIPDNATGIAVVKAAVKSAAKNGATITAIGFYRPGTTDFTDLLKNMTNYAGRSAKLAEMKAQYKSAAVGGDASASKTLKKLEQLDSYGEVGFDAVLIPDAGTSLKSAVAMFGYYDVFSPEVKFIGTSIWENTSLNKETTMRGSWYPALTRQNSSYFNNKYKELFGEQPSSLYAFGYDAVALAAAISRFGSDDLDEKITNPEGYAGINGAFRFFADGRNQHSLDIKEVRGTGNYIVEAGPRKFISAPILSSDSNQLAQMPAIYGKNRTTAEMMIFGRTNN